MSCERWPTVRSRPSTPSRVTACPSTRRSWSSSRPGNAKRLFIVTAFSCKRGLPLVSKGFRHVQIAPNPSIRQSGRPTAPARIIVLGNEKGGSGKSTSAMHLVVALLRSGRSVGVIDLDDSHATLSLYAAKRHAYAVQRDA